MKLEVGKSYVNRKGKIRTIIKHTFEYGDRGYGDGERWYTQTGRWVSDNVEFPEDLITEAPEASATAAATQPDDGGPAFPLPVVDDRDCAGRAASGYGGMSLREWYAAHAPEVPDWFVSTEFPKEHIHIPAMPEIDSLDPQHRDIVRDWLHDPCFDLPEELSWIQDRQKLRNKAMTKRHSEKAMARLVQWRWFYADEMIKASRK